MDWFKGKSEPETIDFPMKIMGLKPVIFPLNQSIEYKKPGHCHRGVAQPGHVACGEPTGHC